MVAQVLTDSVQGEFVLPCVTPGLPLHGVLRLCLHQGLNDRVLVSREMGTPEEDIVRALEFTVHHHAVERLQVPKRAESHRDGFIWHPKIMAQAGGPGTRIFGIYP